MDPPKSLTATVRIDPNCPKSSCCAKVTCCIATAAKVIDTTQPHKEEKKRKRSNSRTKSPAPEKLDIVADQSECPKQVNPQ